MKKTYYTNLKLIFIYFFSLSITNKTNVRVKASSTITARITNRLLKLDHRLNK